jgi:hypothetical protein
MSRAVDKYDITAVADLLAVRIADALVSGEAYTYEDVRRTNTVDGWTYERRGPQRGDVERVESVHLSDDELSRAWLTANRRVDNDFGLIWPS